MSDYNICGVMIHAASDKLQQIENTLNRTQGVEVHARSGQGKLVVTVESEDNFYVADTLSSFKDIDGVLSASMIYQFSDNTTTRNEVYPHEIK